MTGSHTGSDLRLLSRSVFEPLLGVMVPGDLTVGGGVPVPVEVGLQVAWGAGGAGPDDEPQPRLIQRLEVGR